MAAEHNYELEGCRTCGVFSPLQYNYLSPLFGDNRDCNVDNILTLLSSWNIQIEINDGLPQYICRQCILQLSETFKVQKSCLQVQDELRNWYFNAKPELVIKKEFEEDINEDDEYDNYIGERHIRNVNMEENQNLLKTQVEDTIIDSDVNNVNNYNEISTILLNPEQENMIISEEVDLEYENQDELHTETMIICCICHKEFENEADYETHYWQTHTNDEENTIQLNTAENHATSLALKDFVSFSIPNTETTDIDDNDDKDESCTTNEAKHQFECNLCSKSFSFQFSLNRHMKRHHMKRHKTS